MSYHSLFSIKWKLVDKDGEFKPCNHEYPDGAKFCPECGVVIESLDWAVARYIEQHRGFDGAIATCGGSDNMVSWYHCHSDLIKMSNYFQGVVFTLVQYGEEPGAFWVYHFFNGKKKDANASLAFEPFQAYDKFWSEIEKE